jgi:hypothetical protein
VKTLGLIIAVALVSSALTVVATNPRLYVTQAQEAILSRFLQAYCAPDPKWQDGFRLGETAATSRTAIEAGLGPIASIELAKCKLGLAK